MENLFINPNLCRICCLQNDNLLDWNQKLDLEKCNEVSYKDCYYKYTNLEQNDENDPFPPFLCDDCSNELRHVHVFIVKALETQKYLKENITQLVSVVKDELDYDDVECVYMIERDDEESSSHEELYPNPEVSIDFDVVVENEQSEIKEDLHLNETASEDSAVNIDKTKELNKNGRKRRKCDVSNELHLEDETTEPRQSRKRNVFNKTKLSNDDIANMDKTKDRYGNTKVSHTRVMCSYCSKVIHNVYYLKVHEQTHKEHRERNIVCPKCGLKSYNKAAFRIHMKTHDQNREKKFKCEFCDKSYYDRGACNVHRRIHLGQMIKCSICPKEYYRQIDLDKHMTSHSQAPLHMEKPMSKSKYMVHCTQCDKQINSAKFKAHKAAHQNDPFVKCTICEKDFFSRNKCTAHMRRVHKLMGDYEDVVIYYKTYIPRLSHVLMQQQEKIQTKVDF